MMKNILFKIVYLSVLWVGLIPFSAIAQPTIEWSSYYGWYDDYNWAVPANLAGTEILGVEYDKTHHYIYVVGTTTDSFGIASPGSFQSEYFPPFGVVWNEALNYKSLFLAKFDEEGNRIWGTYFYGNLGHLYPSIALDEQGAVYLSGTTFSDSGIATPGSHKEFKPVTTPGTQLQSFIAKFDADGEQVWATYFGGAADTAADQSPDEQTRIYDIAYDPYDQTIVMVGWTNAPLGIATPGTFRENYSGGTNGFVAKFNTLGEQIWGTYLPGTSQVAVVWIGGNGHIYIHGDGATPEIPTAGTYVDYYPPTVSGRAFLMKLDPQGSRVWGTYIGEDDFVGRGSITGHIVNDTLDLIYLQCRASDISDATTPNVHQTEFGGGIYDFLLLQINGADGTRNWSSYFGGEGTEDINYIVTMENYALARSFYKYLATDDMGRVYMMGLIEDGLSDLAFSCYPLVSDQQKSFISSWDENGQLLWSTHHDVLLKAITSGPDNTIYVVGNTLVDGLATPEAHQEQKIVNQRSGFISALSVLPDCPNEDVEIEIQGNTLSVEDVYESYQWYKDDIIITGANDYFYELSEEEEGDYTVIVTDSCGCTYTSRPLFHQGINIEEYASLGVKLYPSPAQDYFYVETGAMDHFTAAQLRVLNLEGSVLKEVTVKPSSLIKVEIQDLTSGIYLIQLMDQDHRPLIHRRITVIK